MIVHVVRRLHLRAAGQLDVLANPQYPEGAAAAMRPTADRIFDPLGRGRRLRVLLAYIRYDYGVPRRGSSYETSAFRDPLCHLGCDVLEAPVDVLRRRFGVSGTGRYLVELAFRHDVDVAFAIPFRDEIAPVALGQIRDRLKIPVVAWFSDDHWRFNDFTAAFLPHVTVAVTTAKKAVDGYLYRGFDRVIRSQWSANHRIFRPLNVKQVHDVSFVGQPHSDRRRLIAKLRGAGVQVITRGFGWPEGRASLREMVELINRSRLCLNAGSASRGTENQVKGRDFEIPATGRPMLTADSEEIREYFGPNEVATYRGADELVETALDLLRDVHRREDMARAGYDRLLRDHTAERRLADLFSSAVSRGWLDR